MTKYTSRQKHVVFPVVIIVFSLQKHHITQQKKLLQDFTKITNQDVLEAKKVGARSLEALGWFHSNHRFQVSTQTNTI